ncbi:MAG: magnesium and cobalt transport protein CorA, partial [Ginsengibacter sp.]
MRRLINTKRISAFINSSDKMSKRLININPTLPAKRTDPKKIYISVYEYNADKVFSFTPETIEDCYYLLESANVCWINIDGLQKEEIEKIGNHFGIHPLIVEDILSLGQRPKMDDLNKRLYCLLNMLYYNERDKSVESEQVSLVLGAGFVISFQEDEKRDLFNPVREKIKMSGSKIRQSNADYLFYSLIDMIVDHYFVIMEQLGEQIEELEDDITHRPDTQTLVKINYLRKEMMYVRRNISPVREMINGILRSENDIIEEKTEKYFKDVYDHIVQANELAENYRDMMINLQDLYLSNVNLKMNEVMKV